MNEPTTVIQGERYRLMLLTPQLIRLEYAPDGIFEDRPTQKVQNRAFPPVEHRLWRTERGIELSTAFMNAFYDEGPFSYGGLWIENRSECRGIYCTWHYGDALTENLGGTARTLDEADGPVPLEPGILSRLQGYSVLDDSTSYALTEDGWIEPPRPGHQDLYFFSYGYAYPSGAGGLLSPVRAHAAAAAVCTGQLVEPFSCLHGRRIPLPHGPV